MSTAHHRGKTAYHAGTAAEDSVARHYEGRAASVLAKRWRGTTGEIDLVIRDGAVVVFVEVKKSRNHAQAAARLTRAQMDRIYQAGSEFLATQARGQLTDVRFDVALVDEQGCVVVVENAFMDA